MKIYENALLQLAGEGRLTLQIPSMIIGNVSKDEETIDLPEEFFMRVKSYPDRAVFGKEQGYLCFSPIGFEIYKEKLGTAYAAKVKEWGGVRQGPDYFKKDGTEIASKEDFIENMYEWFDEFYERTRKEVKKRRLDKFGT